MDWEKKRNVTVISQPNHTNSYFSVGKTLSASFLSNTHKYYHVKASIQYEVLLRKHFSEAVDVKSYPLISVCVLTWHRSSQLTCRVIDLQQNWGQSHAMTASTSTLKGLVTSWVITCKPAPYWSVAPQSSVSNTEQWNRKAPFHFAAMLLQFSPAIHGWNHPFWLKHRFISPILIYRWFTFLEKWPLSFFERHLVFSNIG